MKKAIRLTHYAPDWYLAVLGDAYRSPGELENARTTFEHLAVRMPGSLMVLIRLAAVYGDLGEKELARQTVGEILAINPGFSARAYLQGLPLRLDSDRENLANSLLKAGVPG
jgi:tetratricopeptide (TPR) repeat protein